MQARAAVRRSLSAHVGGLPWRGRPLDRLLSGVPFGHLGKQEMSRVQDLPPPGGFPTVHYRRDLPKRGISGFGFFAVGAAVMIGGL